LENKNKAILELYPGKLSKFDFMFISDLKEIFFGVLGISAI
jgi:hypothetical protein